MAQQFAARVTDLIRLPERLDALASDLGGVLDRVGIRGFSVTINATAPQAGDTDLELEPLADPYTGMDWFEDEPDAPAPPSVESPSVVVASPAPPLSVVASVQLSILEETVIALPGLDGVAFVLAPSGIDATLTASGDGFTLAFATSVAVRLDPTILRPVRRVAGQPDRVAFEPDPTRAFTQIEIGTVSLSVTSDGSIDFGTTIALTLAQPVGIGDTGVVIEQASLSLNLSGDGPRPEGTPASWRGLFISSATIRIPQVFSGSISATGLGIGSGGVSGSLSATFALNYADGQFTGDLAGEVFGLRGGIAGVSLRLQQNVPVGGGLHAQLLLPFFDDTDKPLDIDVSLLPGGDVAVAVHSADGLLRLRKEGVVDFQLATAAFALTGGLFTVTLSGEITPLVADVDWPTFHIDALSIDSDGNVDLAGGWLDLPEQLAMEFHGFQVAISKLGFGTEDDGTRWIGLSGSVRFVDDLAIGGSVEGLKIKWKGSDASVELRGIGVDMVIPDALELHGRVEFIDDGTRTGFKGGIKLTLLPTNITVDAQLLIGRNAQAPAYTFAYVFLAAELPSGIPILSTGLSFFGFSGLVGLNVYPNKLATESWFDGWYLREPIGVSGVEKWTDQRGAFALGIGAVIGTGSDNGYAFHGNFLLVLVLHDGVLVLLDGQAAFLQERPGTPNIYSLAIFDSRAGTLLFNLRATYKYQESGDLLDIIGFAEAYFDFGDLRKWHLYLGMDTPEEKRIRAKIISLFEANAYFMLEYSGVRMGAWFGIKRKWKYGPLKVSLEAWIEGAAAVSWAPKQFDGSLTLNGDVGLKAFGYGIGINLYAQLAARAPHPFWAHAEFSVKLRLPWPLPDPKAHVSLTWERALPPPTPRPLEILGVEHLKVSEKWVMAQAGEPVPIVPLDAKPVLSFQRRMNDDTGLATNAVPSSSERVGPFRFRYRLQQLALERRGSTGEPWVDASTPLAPSLPAGSLWTTWQAVAATGAEGSPQDVAPMTKLMLWSKTPFDGARETTGTAVSDGFLDANPNWPCRYTWDPVMECGDFTGRTLGPLPPISPLGRMVVAARKASVIATVGAWVPVDRSAWIESKSDPATYNEKTGPDLQEPALRIVFPAATAAAYLYIGEGTRGLLLVPGEKPMVIGPMKEPLLVLISPAVPYIELLYQVRLLQVCFVSQEEWDRTQKGKASTDAVGAGAANKLAAQAELLWPHNDYRLSVTTIAERSDDGGDHWVTAGTFGDVGYFRTEGPPGVDAGRTADALAPAANSEHYPGRGPLHDLGPYVLRTVPVHGSAPVYRSYDVSVEFNESYVEAMYLLEGAPLALQLEDANGAPVRGTDGKPLDLIVQSRSLAPAQLSEVTYLPAVTWQKRLASSCGGAPPPSGPPPTAMSITHPRLLLAGEMVHRGYLTSIPPSLFVALGMDGKVARTGAGDPLVIIPASTEGGRLDQINIASSGRTLALGENVVVEMAFGALPGAAPFALQTEMALLTTLLPAVFAPPSPSRVFDWSFTTSRYATFTHHLHSFDGSLASLHVQRGAPAVPLLDAAALTWLDGLVKLRPLGLPAPVGSPQDRARAREDEGLLYDAIARVLGLEAPPLPAALTLTRLDDALRSYGLHLQSPEPLAWERMLLTQTRSAAAINELLAPSATIKVVGVALAQADDPASLVKEYVDVLLRESVDPSGFRLQVFTGGAWQDHWVFAEAEVLPAGTVIRVHTGAAAQDAGAPIEFEHRYAGDAGGGAARRFVGSARTRLLDGNGVPVHERAFPVDVLVGQSFRIVRSRDDCSAFVFLPEGAVVIGTLPAAMVRMSWTYRRNILPAEPIQRRRGSDAAEVVTLDLWLG